MSLVEAIVYLIASGGHGLRVEQITDMINARGLHHRKDGNPVTIQQVYAVIMRHRETFVKEDGRIRLIM